MTSFFVFAQDLAGDMLDRVNRPHRHRCRELLYGANAHDLLQRSDKLLGISILGQQAE